jgi:hypothetical protein
MNGIKAAMKSRRRRGNSRSLIASTSPQYERA